MRVGQMTPERGSSCEGQSAYFTGAPRLLPSVTLFPVSVVALGAADRPFNQLMMLQPAMARWVHLVTQIARIWPSPSARGWPRLYLQSARDPEGTATTSQSNRWAHGEGR
jgi:hypothetical protein